MVLVDNLATLTMIQWKLMSWTWFPAWELGRDGHRFEHLMGTRETSGDVKKFID